MRYILIISFIILTSFIAAGQTAMIDQKATNQGSMYFYWGWNRSWFGKSTIHLKGADYDFKLKKVRANDRQTEFSLHNYFHPSRLTIPQYNFRVGYFFKENWDISFGIDHMKYVLEQGQEVGIAGFINNSGPIYDGFYDDEKIIIARTLLILEHTDGLNYANIDLRHSNKIIDLAKFKVSLTKGLGVGILVPKTNAILFGKDRYDAFHLSGYGISGVAGINLTFLNAFFIQSEFKQGFINLPNVRTTSSKRDNASHSFFFSQLNIVFGGTIKIKNRTKNR